MPCTAYYGIKDTDATEDGSLWLTDFGAYPDPVVPGSVHTLSIASKGRDGHWCEFTTYRLGDPTAYDISTRMPVWDLHVQEQCAAHEDADLRARAAA